jgi:alkanesulfonate monooxygenase SsuD/methylene tetrahydromethanopterin reductase-like flavin-dependent oxidoreductase (luciferase family)
VPVHDGPVLLAAWAATTTRIRIGLLIANVVIRRPTLLTKQAVTIDHVSAGRFELGIGSGRWPIDHAMAGLPALEPHGAGRTARRALSGAVSAHNGTC